MSSGYFRAELATAKAIAKETGSPDALIAWLALRRFAFGHGRSLTAAGAKAIGSALGVSWRTSGRILRELLAIRLGERGEHPVLLPAREWNALHGTTFQERRAKRTVYYLPEIHQEGEEETGPDERCAYLPDALFPPGGARSDLAALRSMPGPDALDALLALLVATARVSVGDYLGADPARFTYGHWRMDGHSDYGDGYELGYMGSHGRQHFWLAELHEEHVAASALDEVTGGTADVNEARFWRALSANEAAGLLHKVTLTISASGRRELLWIHSKRKERHLANKWGIEPTARRNLNDAIRAGIGPASSIHEDFFREEIPSGLFVLVTDCPRPPTVLSVYAPTLMAPTKRNTAELALWSPAHPQA